MERYPFGRNCLHCLSNLNCIIADPSGVFTLESISRLLAAGDLVCMVGLSRLLPHLLSHILAHCSRNSLLYLLVNHVVSVVHPDSLLASVFLNWNVLGEFIEMMIAWWLPTVIRLFQGTLLEFASVKVGPVCFISIHYLQHKVLFELFTVVVNLVWHLRGRWSRWVSRWLQELGSAISSTFKVNAIRRSRIRKDFVLWLGWASWYDALSLCSKGRWLWRLSRRAFIPKRKFLLTLEQICICELLYGWFRVNLLERLYWAAVFSVPPLLGREPYRASIIILTDGYIIDRILA